MGDFSRDAGNILPPGGGTPNKVPKFSSTGNTLENSSIVEETNRIRFDKKAKFPAASVGIGEVMELSEGIGELVVVNLLKDKMAFAASVGFDDATGSDAPTFPNFGNEFTLNINTDDTQVLTANPLTFQLTGTVTAPEVRVVKKLTLRTNVPNTFSVAKSIVAAPGAISTQVCCPAGTPNSPKNLALVLANSSVPSNEAPVATVTGGPSCTPPTR